MTQSNPKSGPPVVIPGRAIGPVSIGMTRQELARAGLELKPHPSGQLGDAVQIAGPYQIVFQEDRVASVALTVKDSPAGISIDNRTFASTATLQQIASALPDCGEVEEREGGAVVTCSGGTTLVKSGGESRSIEIQVIAAGLLR